LRCPQSGFYESTLDEEQRDAPLSRLFRHVLKRANRGWAELFGPETIGLKSGLVNMAKVLTLTAVG
jgi:hypothetical protein